MSALGLAVGFGFAALGAYTVVRPQRVAALGLGGNVEDAELTDSGRAAQRLKGLVLAATGLVVVLLVGL